MKRFFTLLATALLAVLPLSAAQTTDLAKTETKDYQLNGFDGLQVSWVYHVELSQAPRHAVRVEAPDFVMPYIRVEVRDGNLILAVEEMPKDIRRRIESGNRFDVRAYVSMPVLNVLKMSGASKLTARGEFSSRQNVELSLSGASVARDLSVKAASIDIEASGASKIVDLTGKTDKLFLRASGSAATTMAADPKTVDLGLSGAAKLSLKGKLGDVELRASGAVNVEFDGSIEFLDADGSGASKLSASRAPVRRARISFSGASGGMIDVRDELSVTLSGAAKLNYHPGPALRITHQSISRGATLSSY